MSAVHPFSGCCAAFGAGGMLRVPMRTLASKASRKKRHLVTVLHKRVEEQINASPVLHKHKFKKPTHLLQPTLTNATPDTLDDAYKQLNTGTTYDRVESKTQVPVATLEHGLQKTLFKRGVHPLRNPLNNKLHFSPFLEKLTQPDEFDYDALQPYITSSKDKTLEEMAKETKARFVGSTSSVSGILSQIYFLLSNSRPVDKSFLSSSYTNPPFRHTRGARCPKAIYLRFKDGTYAVDVDKSFDIDTNVLAHMGKSMEKLLTSPPDEYNRFLKANSSSITEEERNAPEAFAYGRFGDLLLRSQLDCYHHKLPRRTFDLKTRATMPVRLDIPHYRDYYNYTLEQYLGLFYSFEREYFDMVRSAFLKYSFQVRIGHMDGIMVTYHNTDKIFGFQYISREEMDARLFGTTKMGDEAFKNSLAMMQLIFQRATKRFPEQTLRLTFDASAKQVRSMKVYVEPVPEDNSNSNSMSMSNAKKEETTTIPSSESDKKDTDASIYAPLSDEMIMYDVQTASFLNGQRMEGPVAVNHINDKWDVYYKVEENPLPKDVMVERFSNVRKYMATVFLPQSDESPDFLEQYKKKRLPRKKKRRQRANSPDDKQEAAPSVPFDVAILQELAKSTSSAPPMQLNDISSSSSSSSSDKNPVETDTKHEPSS
ncbi:mitochondrial protein Pet127-domain-containing protein [Gongronella butleri]|nr:mitochondrial protein Pet127-domain-containing protein [Gongronella butleri]